MVYITLDNTSDFFIMAALIYFLAVLSVSVACYAVCRLVGYRPKFKSVANVAAHVFCFAPIVAMSFVLISGVGAVVLALLALLLHTTGDLPAVRAWGVWHLLPEWAWFAIAAATSYCSFMVYGWREVIAEWFTHKQRKG